MPETKDAQLKDFRRAQRERIGLVKYVALETSLLITLVLSDAAHWRSTYKKLVHLYNKLNVHWCGNGHTPLTKYEIHR